MDATIRESLIKNFNIDPDKPVFRNGQKVWPNWQSMNLGGKLQIRIAGTPQRKTVDVAELSNEQTPAPKPEPAPTGVQLEIEKPASDERKLFDAVKSLWCRNVNDFETDGFNLPALSVQKFTGMNESGDDETKFTIHHAAGYCFTIRRVFDMDDESEFKDADGNGYFFFSEFDGFKKMTVETATRLIQTY